jgi:hypothetical protein
MAAASAVDNPVICSVNKDADATRTLQPTALNRACDTVCASSTCIENRTCAPQLNDAARPVKLGSAASPTLRGLKK